MICMRATDMASATPSQATQLMDSTRISQILQAKFLRNSKIMPAQQLLPLSMDQVQTLSTSADSAITRPLTCVQPIKHYPACTHPTLEPSPATSQLHQELSSRMQSEGPAMTTFVEILQITPSTAEPETTPLPVEPAMTPTSLIPPMMLLLKRPQKAQT